MTCSPTLISAYHDGVLGSADRHLVENHLRRCPACRAMLHDYQALRRSLSALPRYDAPSRIWGELQAQLAARNLRPRHVSRWNPLFASAAAMVVLISAALAGASIASQGVQPLSRPVVAFALPNEEAAGVSPESVIEIRFNTPVDRNAVQQTLNVSPPVPARVEWQTNNMRIVPDQRLDSDTTYTISVGAGQEKQNPIQFSLRTGQTPGAPTGNGAQVQTASRTPTAPLAVMAVASTTPISPQPAPGARITTASAAPSNRFAACATAPGQRLQEAIKVRPDAQALGCPTESEWATTLTVQPFEGGVMLWSPDLAWVYVLKRQDTVWQAHSPDKGNGATPGVLQPTRPRPAALLTSTPTVTATGQAARKTEPLPSGPAAEGWRRLTLLWLQDVSVRNAMGLPVERDTTAAGSVQGFEKGIVIGAPDALYILTDDGSWCSFDDASRSAAPPGAP